MTSEVARRLRAMADVAERSDGCVNVPMMPSNVREIAAICDAFADAEKPIPMRITCPECCELHVDEGEFATKPHRSHTCQSCGLTWRPAIVATVGVRFLPGLKNERMEER